MARLFDQSNEDFLEFGDISSIDITGDEITVSVWLELDTANGEQKLVSKWSDSPLAHQYLMSITSAEKLQFVINNGGQRIALGSTTISTGIWHNLVGRYNGSNVRAYIDGVQDGTLNASGNIVNTSAPLVLGAGSGGSGSEQPLDGFLGHCAIWDVPLSEGEIESLANGISPLAIRRDNLMFYAPLNGQNPELDVVSGLDLTVNGTTVSEEPPIPNSIKAA